MMKKIAESDDYWNFKKKYQGVKADAQDFSDKLWDQIESSEGAAGNVRDVGTVLFSETAQSQAVRSMKAFDPEFELSDLHHETEEIFTEFFNAFLDGDLEYLEKFSAEEALGIVKGELEIREKNNWEYECKEIIDVTNPVLCGSEIKRGMPWFSFQLSCQEIDCKVDRASGEIMEGEIDNVIATQYLV